MRQSQIESMTKRLDNYMRWWGWKPYISNVSVDDGCIVRMYKRIYDPSYGISICLTFQELEYMRISFYEYMYCKLRRIMRLYNVEREKRNANLCVSA